ncbi:MAG: hypothetical protein PHH54_03950 [Candidatus Nanoarchaeia archaeon]|nr:hypothetical protein [Candidatus Nanoarchaeia archaeon]MDD5741113.1 hypothetical protein [Candidatus Nanoarchaeia archaeon]
MAIEGVVNASDVSNALWPLVSEALAPLMTIFKIVGIVLLVYIIYLIIRGILNYRRNTRIDITYEKVLEIDKKLDELLKRTPKREKKPEKPEKNPGFFAKLFGRKEIKKEKKK